MKPSPASDNFDYAKLGYCLIDLCQKLSQYLYFLALPASAAVLPFHFPLRICNAGRPTGHQPGRQVAHLYPLTNLFGKLQDFVDVAALGIQF